MVRERDGYKYWSHAQQQGWNDTPSITPYISLSSSFPAVHVYIYIYIYLCLSLSFSLVCVYIYIYIYIYISLYLSLSFSGNICKLFCALFDNRSISGVSQKKSIRKLRGSESQLEESALVNLQLIHISSHQTYFTTPHNITTCFNEMHVFSFEPNNKIVFLCWFLYIYTYLYIIKEYIYIYIYMYIYI